jgi:hypothetical protein
LERSRNPAISENLVIVAHLRAELLSSSHDHG